MMRSAIVLVLVAFVSGCQQPQEEPAMYSESPQRAATLDELDANAPAYEPQPQLQYEPPPDPETETEPIATTTTSDGLDVPPGAQVHVVRPKDTLFKLAREYYNDQARWRDIWNANINRVPDPDKLNVGMKLIIP